MSRIGKKPVQIPSGVNVTVSDDRTVTVEGKSATLTMTHRPEVTVRVDEDPKAVIVEAEKPEHGNTKAYWGTTRSLIENMIEGVTNGYQKQLQIVGVGWGATVAGQKLDLKVGVANTISVPIPTGLDVSVEKDIVTVKGADKQMVGEFAAVVRSKRKPEPYNGKGIRYLGEDIIRKQGKAFGS
jgi:large subunit ribosomal protein L6